MLDAVMAQWEFRFSPHSWVSWTGKLHRLVILSFLQFIWTQDFPCWSTASGLCAAAGRATRADTPKANSATAADKATATTGAFKEAQARTMRRSLAVMRMTMLAIMVLVVVVGSNQIPDALVGRVPNNKRG